MTDPRRFLDEAGIPKAAGSAHDALRAALLRAAKRDAPPPEARQKVLSALGLDEHSVSVAAVPASGVRPILTPRFRDRPPLFSSALSGWGAPPRTFGGSAGFSVLAHAALVALLVHSSSTTTTIRAEEHALTLRLEARGHAVARGTGAPRAKLALPSEALPGPKLSPRGLGIERDLRKEAPAAPDQPPLEQAAIGRESTPASAEEGNASGVAPSLPSPSSEEILPFGEGMSRPRRIEGPEPEYPLAARKARVSGTMLVKCVITTTGALRNCKILKSLPLLDEAVLAALEQQRYTPVTFQGRTINVEYVIPLKFELP